MCIYESANILHKFSIRTNNTHLYTYMMCKSKQGECDFVQI